MKKLLCLLLALVMLFSLCACGDSADSDDDGEKTSKYPKTYRYTMNGQEFTLKLTSKKNVTLTFSREIDEDTLEEAGVDSDGLTVTMVYIMSGKHTSEDDVCTAQLDTMHIAMEVEGEGKKEAIKTLTTYFNEEVEGPYEDYAEDLFSDDGADFTEFMDFKPTTYVFEFDDEDLSKLTVYEEDSKDIAEVYTFYSNGKVKTRTRYEDGEPYYCYEYDKNGELTDDYYYEDRNEPPTSTGVDYPDVPTPPSTGAVDVPETQPIPTTRPPEPSIEIPVYNIYIWVPEELVYQTYAQIEAFNSVNENNFYIYAEIVGVSAYDAAYYVCSDVAYAPDLFCFTQEYTYTLSQAGALSMLPNEFADWVWNNNDSTTCLSACDSNYNVMAYPMSASNGYFLYYDTSILSRSDVQDLESIIAVCEANGRDFCFELENAWYAASFFFATGCTSEWILDADNNFTGLNDDFNSYYGLQALQGMQKLTTSSCYVNASYPTGNTGALVAGTWLYEDMCAYYGENLGVVQLPSFNVDGYSYHLSSFSGTTLMGVKPQENTDRQYILYMLAQYLTGEKCQLERYEECRWCPSNYSAQVSEAVQSHPAMRANIAQFPFSIPQRQIHGAWWDIAAQIARNLRSGMELQQILDEYESALYEALNPVSYQWSVIGSIEGTSWDHDFDMEERSDGTWCTVDALYLEEDTEFKIRYGHNWDLNYGVNGERDGANWVAGVTGYYYVVFDPSSGMCWIEEA